MTITTEQRIDNLERRIAELERNQQFAQPRHPYQPTVVGPLKVVCPKCGIDLMKASGYCCVDTNCPTQSRITC